MDAIEALSLFEDAKGPSRKLDDAVAQVVGWSPRFEIIQDPNTGEAKRVQKSVWLVPEGNEERRVPAYSSNASDAFELLSLLAKGVPCATSKTPEGAFAQLWEEQRFSAPTIAMAMCMAALHHLAKAG